MLARTSFLFPMLASKRTTCTKTGQHRACCPSGSVTRAPRREHLQDDHAGQSADGLSACWGRGREDGAWTGGGAGQRSGRGGGEAASFFRGAEEEENGVL